MNKNHFPKNDSQPSRMSARRGVGRLLGVTGVALGLMVLLLASLAVRTPSTQASGLALPAAVALPVGQDSTDLSAPSTPQAIPWTVPANAYRISVKADGIYALSYDYLQAAGLPVTTLDPRTFRMVFMGQEMPIQVIGESDGRFDAADSVIFYGRNVDTLFYDGLFSTNKYVNNLVFFLSYGAGNGLRMSTVSGTPTGATAKLVTMEHVLSETNQWYFSEYPPLPISGADHYFGQWIQALGPTARSTNMLVSASDVDTGASGNLVMTFQGYANGPHYVRLYLNATQIYSGTGDWSDFGDTKVTVPITPGLFVNGANIIKVELVNIPGRTYDKIYVNWMQLDYPRHLIAQADTLNIRGVTTGTWTFNATGFSTSDVGVYDVTDPFNVRRIINGTPSALGPVSSQEAASGISFGAAVTPKTRFFLAAPGGHQVPDAIEAVVHKTSNYTPANLLATSNRYDYIIITHGDFWNEILPLAQYRNFFYKVALVDVQTIYDQFNGGMMSAEAIRDFLGYARNNWSGAHPEFLLLVGDGAVDMRKFSSISASTFIPPFLVSVDPYLGETAADNRFVMLEGNDVLPDMAVGRFPAATPAQVATMVKKTLDYEVKPPVGDWTKNVLFISDDLEGGGGDFYGFSEVLASGFANPPTNTIRYLPPEYHATRVYLGQTCDLNNESPATQCEGLITETLNITGAMLVSYVGHASRNEWALENLLDGQLVSQLNNSDKLPVILAMTCLEGSFQDSTVLSLAESYMRASGGAVASWSPTGLGVANGHDVLEQSFFRNLFTNGVTELGRLTVLGKYDLHAHDTTGRFEDLIDTYVLFGDPALRIQTYQAPTAVEMAGLDAVALGNAVHLSWRTVSESDLAGFNVLRVAVDAATGQEQGNWIQVNSAPIPAQGGGSAQGFTYLFTDPDLTVGTTYRYALELIKSDGTLEKYGQAEAQANSSQTWQLFLPLVER